MIHTTKNYRIEFSDVIKGIVIYNLNDTYNHTASFNKNKRGYNKFKKDFSGIINQNDQSSFNQWVNVMNLPKYNLKMHTWCMTD